MRLGCYVGVGGLHGKRFQTGGADVWLHSCSPGLLKEGNNGYPPLG
jgi:hypothetical protein